MLAGLGSHSSGSVVMSETPIESLVRIRAKELGITLEGEHIEDDAKAKVIGRALIRFT